MIMDGEGTREEVGTLIAYYTTYTVQLLTHCYPPIPQSQVGTVSSRFYGAATECSILGGVLECC